MRIRQRQLAAGPKGVVQAGTVYEIDDDAFVEEFHEELPPEPKPEEDGRESAKAKAAPETAAKEAPENAEAPRSKRGRK